MTEKIIILRISIKALLLASVTMSFLSCSSGPPPATVHEANSVYYQSLKENVYIKDPRSQPPEGEVFSENTKMFDLVQLTSKQASKITSGRTLSDEFAIYMPARSKSSGLGKVAADAVPGGGIPGFKPADVIPEACANTVAADLRECLDVHDLGTSPEPQHTTFHDSISLGIMLGDGAGDAIARTVITAFNNHIDNATRNSVQSQLNSYISALPPHAGLNLDIHGIYDMSGYSLHSAVLTDGSRSDLDSDGNLEPHSTLIVELRKPLLYTRLESSRLDTFIKKYNNGVIPPETHEIILKAYIHLDHLASHRQVIPPSPSENLSQEQQTLLLEQIYEAKRINHALDANVIKKILISNGNISWNSTEYSLAFQLSGGTLSNHYAQILANAEAEGDAEAVAALEEHVDAQAAILTGGGDTFAGVQKSSVKNQVTAFYQVSRPDFRTNKSAVTSGYEYVTVDSSGRRMAMYDPASGALIYAGMTSKFASGTEKAVAMTKRFGVCTDRPHQKADGWRLRTGRFGRGSQWIMTEWLIHNQAGDYKNIHWYQSIWKSGVQIAVKGGKYVGATYLKIAFGAIKLPKDPDERSAMKRRVYFIKTVLPLLRDIVMKFNGMDIAGYKISIPSSVGDFVEAASSAFGITPPDTSSADTSDIFDVWFLLDVSDGPKSFLIDRITDAAAQMVDVAVVGWQDISDRSHHGCFEFD